MFYNEVIKMHETLLHEAQENNIRVVYWPFKDKIKGLYYDNVIAINRNAATTAEKACILAEELGHYHTTAGDILDQTKPSNRKQERRARRWAYERLVSPDKLVTAHKKGIKTRHELAEFFDVTEEFLVAAIHHYKEKHGLCYRVGKYQIYFEPLRIVKILKKGQ